MIEAVKTGITDVLSWIGDVISSIVTDTGKLHALLPLFAIGIAISAILLGIKIIRSVVWGS